ncbi:MAG: hypothetical protein SFU98_18165 [Leptospiraceae bacterium]|nr:hypothetical protein [Leptospiraceae bacterium]
MSTPKKIYGSREIEANISEIVQKNYLHFELKGLTRHTRDIISSVVNGILERIGADPLSSFHLFSGVMEALLNAVKANIRFTIFKKEVRERLFDIEPSKQEVDQILAVILETTALRDAIQRYVVPDKIKREVQQILTLEEKIRVKKQEITEKDKLLLFSIRNEIKKDERKISMKIMISENQLLLRIRNDSPIMDIDMERIKQSREKHYQLYLDGRSSEFFRPEFLDEKESAGFGVAMIDEGYYSIGLNPIDLFTYIQSKHATTVYMSYPIDKLQSGAFG